VNFITSLEWNLFIPDVIVAVITGLVVGAAITWSQKRSELRREKFQTQLLWDDFRGALQVVVLKTDIDPFDWIGQPFDTFLPKVAAELIDLTRGRRLRSWANILNDPEIRLLEKVIDDIRAAEVAVYGWHADLLIAVNQTVPQLHGNLDRIMPLMQGRVLAMTAEQILAAMAGPGMPSTLNDAPGGTSLQDSATRALDHDAIASRSQAVGEILLRLRRDYSSLESAVKNESFR